MNRSRSRFSYMKRMAALSAADVPLDEAEIFTCRIVVIGESAVGKTSMARTFSCGGSIENVETTIGAAFLTHSVDIDGRRVKFDIWDTAGQERFYSLTPMYYRGAQGAIVVYDVTEPLTFDRARHWVNELRRQADMDIVVALSGNKCDLRERRAVNQDHTLLTVYGGWMCQWFTLLGLGIEGHGCVRCWCSLTSYCNGLEVVCRRAEKCYYPTYFCSGLET